VNTVAGWSSSPTRHWEHSQKGRRISGSVDLQERLIRLPLSDVGSSHVGSCEQGHIYTTPQSGKNCIQWGAKIGFKQLHEVKEVLRIKFPAQGKAALPCEEPLERPASRISSRSTSILRGGLATIGSVRCDHLEANHPSRHSIHRGWIFSELRWQSTPGL
jgi:hypothetical protein